MKDLNVEIYKILQLCLNIQWIHLLPVLWYWSRDIFKDLIIEKLYFINIIRMKWWKCTPVIYISKCTLVQVHFIFIVNANFKILMCIQNQIHYIQKYFRNIKKQRKIKLLCNLFFAWTLLYFFYLDCCGVSKHFYG